MQYRRIFFTLAAMLCAAAAIAQTVDNPVVMTVAGKDITRAEFEYSYNKNTDVEGAVEQKSVSEYAEMFVNYKLKVAAAERLRKDTLSSFQREFRQYRDMQLTPYLVDMTFVDSVGRSVYQQTVERIGGKDLLLCRHILLPLKQNADEATKTAVAARADSIYTALQGGANFEELVTRYSADYGTVKQGGQLPWMGPGMVFKEFEDVAYQLSPTEISKPVLSPVGYHIIRMDARKQMEPYEELREDIFAALKQQGIEGAAAQSMIDRLMRERQCTREEVMDSVLAVRVKADPNLQYLVQEYYDGLLLYEVAKEEVWDKAANDEKGLAAVYAADKKKYAWAQPRFKGFVYFAKDKAAEKRVKAFLKKADNESEEWRSQLKATINKDSTVVVVMGPYLVKQGENKAVDKLVFGTGEGRTLKDYPLTGVVGKKLKQPSSYRDVKAIVQEDYQNQLETAWVEQLRKQFPHTIYQGVLGTVNKH